MSLCEGQELRRGPFDLFYVPSRIRRQMNKTTQVRPYSKRRERRRLEREMKKNNNIRF